MGCALRRAALAPRLCASASAGEAAEKPAYSLALKRRDLRRVLRPVNKKVCELLGVRKASFADAETTAQMTRMLIGGVVAIGIQDLPIYVDRAVLHRPEVVMGGGNRSSKLRLNPQELLKLPNVKVIVDLANPKDTARRVFRLVDSSPAIGGLTICTRASLGIEWASAPQSS